MSWWKYLTAIWITAVIWAAFNLIPPAMGLGELSRIAWFHIPVAWICVLAFGTAVVCSIRYLKSRDLLWDDRAVTAAEIGPGIEYRHPAAHLRGLLRAPIRGR